MNRPLGNPQPSSDELADCFAADLRADLGFRASLESLRLVAELHPQGRAALSALLTRWRDEVDQAFADWTPEDDTDLGGRPPLSLDEEIARGIVQEVETEARGILFPRE